MFSTRRHHASGGVVHSVGPHAALVNAMTDIPPQERQRKWFKSHLLGYELELQIVVE